MGDNNAEIRVNAYLVPNLGLELQITLFVLPLMELNISVI